MVESNEKGVSRYRRAVRWKGVYQYMTTSVSYVRPMPTAIIHYQRYWSRRSLPHVQGKDLIKPILKDHVIISRVLLAEIYDVWIPHTKAERIECLADDAQRYLVRAVGVRTQECRDPVLCLHCLDSAHCVPYF